MFGVFTVFAFLVITVLLLIEKITVNIGKSERYEFEFHFVFFALHLKSRKKDKAKDGRRKKGVLPRSRIISAVIRLCEVGEVEIKNVTLRTPEPPDSNSYTNYYRYYSLFSAIVGYLDDKTPKLTVSDNAFTLNPDSKEIFSFDLSVKVYLFDLLLIIISLMKDYRKYKRRKKEYSNVRN